MIKIWQLRHILFLKHILLDETCEESVTAIEERKRERKRSPFLLLSLNCSHGLLAKHHPSRSICSKIQVEIVVVVVAIINHN